MAYEERRLARQKVRYDNDNDDIPLVYQLVDAGAKVTPTSATIAVVDPSGDTVLAATAMTVSGTLMTYSLDTSTEADFPIDQGYRADMVITADSKTYQRHIIFDVARYVFVPNVAYDQLVALDDELRGMQHDGDADFSPIIEASRDELQLLIESRLLTLGKRMLEEHILDASRMAIPFRRMVLANIFREKGDIEKAEHHESMYARMYDAVMSSLELDEDQDGNEDGEIEEPVDTVYVR